MRNLPPTNRVLGWLVGIRQQPVLTCLLVVAYERGCRSPLAELEAVETKEQDQRPKNPSRRSPLAELEAVETSLDHIPGVMRHLVAVRWPN